MEFWGGRFFFYDFEGMHQYSVPIFDIYLTIYIDFFSFNFIESIR